MSKQARPGTGRGLSRRELIGGMVGTAAVGLGAAGGRSAAAAAAFNWKRYAGEQIRFIGLKAMIETFWNGMLPDFEKDTGIKVIFEDYEQAQSRQKLATEMVARTGTIDTFRTTKMQDFPQYWQNGWFEVLDAFLADAGRTDPELNLPDFFSGALESCKIDGKLVALPVTSGAQILFYRKDLFDAKGLKVPATMEEMETTAKALHNPPTVYGFASRGQKSAAVSMFASFLHNFGADWMAGGKPSLNTPEAIAAYTYYGRVLQQYGPPGVVNMSHVELGPMFGEGKIAMLADDLSFASVFDDEKKSKVAGKVGYAKLPAGPKRDTPTIYVYGMAMTSQSKHKDATWYWIQWMSSAAVQVRGMLRGVAGVRASAWKSPEFLKTAKKDWVEAAQITLQKGNDEWAPPVISVPEARDIVGLPITVAVEGGDVKAACERANRNLEALARRDGVLR